MTSWPVCDKKQTTLPFVKRTWQRINRNYDTHKRRGSAVLRKALSANGDIAVQTIEPSGWLPTVIAEDRHRHHRLDNFLALLLTIRARLPSDLQRWCTRTAMRCETTSIQRRCTSTPMRGATTSRHSNRKQKTYHISLAINTLRKWPTEQVNHQWRGYKMRKAITKRLA